MPLLLLSGGGLQLGLHYLLASLEGCLEGLGLRGLGLSNGEHTAGISEVASKA